MSDSLHPFEAAGLGRAPFIFVGHTRKVGPLKLGCGTEVGAPGQPMGTCDYCGQGIADCYAIRSADGKVSEVGCDCINKIYKASNKTSSELARDKVYQETRRAILDAKNASRKASQDKKIAELLAQVAEHESLLKGLPHCKSYWAEQGQTRWDELQWYLQNAGRKGKLDALKMALKRVEKELGK